MDTATSSNQCRWWRWVAQTSLSFLEQLEGAEVLEQDFSVYCRPQEFGFVTGPSTSSPCDRGTFHHKGWHSQGQASRDTLCIGVLIWKWWIVLQQNYKLNHTHMVPEWLMLSTLMRCIMTWKPPVLCWTIWSDLIWGIFHIHIQDEQWPTILKDKNKLLLIEKNNMLYVIFCHLLPTLHTELNREYTCTGTDCTYLQHDALYLSLPHFGKCGWALCLCLLWCIEGNSDSDEHDHHHRLLPHREGQG
jgi:hypothetical protein